MNYPEVWILCALGLTVLLALNGLRAAISIHRLEVEVKALREGRAGSPYRTAAPRVEPAPSAPPWWGRVSAAIVRDWRHSWGRACECGVCAGIRRAAARVAASRIEPSYIPPVPSPLSRYGSQRRGTHGGGPR